MFDGAGVPPRRGKSASALVRLTARSAPGSTPLSSPWAKYWPAMVGAKGQSLPNRTCLGRPQSPLPRPARPAEDVVATGWHIDDHASFERIEARIRAHGVPVVRGSDEEAALRGVERLLRFPGPKGITQEIYTTPVTSAEPLRMLASGWVTGDSGMGHVAITSAKPTLLRASYNTVFDARLTDCIEETISGIKLKIRFLRVNERHHSITIAAVRGLPIDPIRTRVQHLNIQAATLDDVTQSYQRVHELGFETALSVGRHTNDKELSYYARTPSGFEWEVGWNPLVIDENTWEPGTHQGISIWGHKPVGQTIVDKFDEFRLGARSLARPERTVPALSGAGIPDD